MQREPDARAPFGDGCTVVAGITRTPFRLFLGLVVLAWPIG